MSDPTQKLIASLIKDGKHLATLLEDAKTQPSGDTEKLKEIHANVTALIPQILNELNVQTPPSFSENIIPKILAKVQATLQKFKDLDPENASDYEKLVKDVNDCKSQKQKNWALRSSSSGVPQRMESPTSDSTQLDSSASDVSRQDRFRSLTVKEKKCLFCLCLFPAGKELRKREPMHLWAGMDLIADPLKAAEMLDKLGDEAFIEPAVANKKDLNRYKMNERVRSMVVKEMSIQFSDDTRFSIMDQNQQQPTAAQQQQQQQPQLHQSPSQQPATENPLIKRMSFLRRDSKSFDKKDQADNLSGTLMLNLSENNLQATTFERISKKKADPKVLHLGSLSQESKSYVVVEEAEAAFKALTRHAGQASCLSLQGVSGIVKLPDSVYKLENLKVLDMRGCPNLESLSNGIQSLKQLTHLDLSECYLLEHIPQGIALLTELRVLKGFVINREGQNGNVEKAFSCASFSDLEALKKLIKLTISSRRIDFPTSNDFRTLGEMENLTNLKITWVCNSTEVPNASDSEKFPPSLKKLELQATPENTMLRLLKLISDDTENRLQKLYIRGGRFQDFGTEMQHYFRHVHKVRLRHLPELCIHWGEFRKYFPNLTRLEVFGCLKFMFLPCDENGVWDVSDIQV